MQVTATQTRAILDQLAMWQPLTRPDIPAYGPLLDMNWSRVGQLVGLRGNPHNAQNSLTRRSRLFEAVSPTGERCMGFFLRDGANTTQGDLFLVSPSRGEKPSFRLELPPPFRSYRHCTDLLKEGGLAFLRVHTKTDREQIVSRLYVRALNLGMGWWALASEDSNRPPQRNPQPHSLSLKEILHQVESMAPNWSSPVDEFSNYGFTISSCLPTGQRLEGFLVPHRRDHERAFLILPMEEGQRAITSAFRLEGPTVPRDQDEPLSIHLLTPELGQRGETQPFVRTRDVWRPKDASIDRSAVEAYIGDPGRLPLWEGLSVTHPIDADSRFSDSGIRFLLGGQLEGALAAHRLGMTWLRVQKEDDSCRGPWAVMSYQPLAQE